MAGGIPPILRLAVLCDSIEAAGDGRPFSLNAPVHTIRFGPDVRTHYRPSPPTLYLQLHGGAGTFYVWAALREEGETTLVYRTRKPYEGVFADDRYRVVPLELALELPGLTFPRPGVYELLIYANYVNLHDPAGPVPFAFPPIRITALPADGSEGGVL